MRRSRFRLPVLLLALLAAYAPPSPAEDPASPPPDAPAEKDSKEPAEKKKTEKKPDSPLKTLTKGKIPLAGKEISYEAETDTIGLLDGKDAATASIFYVHYRRTDAAPAAARPILFCFNGGPGSSAAWLHLGGLGPRRVVLPADGTEAPAPPFALEDNPDCVLDTADLVFVDPVNTGYSRPEKDKDVKQFFGYKEDVGYLAEFIRRFVSEHDRWASPKHLIGESYGALRVAALADELQEKNGMYLNGVILLSGLLDFRTLSTEGGNDLPYVCYLPAMAANARFHGRLKNPPPLESLVAGARAFAFGDYATSLLAGQALDPSKREAVAAKLESFTGIPAATWLDANLRLDPAVFRKLLLKDSKMQIGRFDGRVKGAAVDPLFPQASGDPSFDLAWGPFCTTINDYLRRTLKASTPQSYDVINGNVRPWDYGASNTFMRVDDRLVSAMRANPHLRVLVQSGRYDLATPPDSIGHTLSQLDLPDKLRANIRTETYDGGHMFYTNRAASAKMRADLVRFLTPDL